MAYAGNCLGCGCGIDDPDDVLCPRCEADEAEAWQTFDRVESDREAAIETLRAMLLERAAMYANRTIPIWSFGKDGPDWVPDPRFDARRACLAIALALLL